MSLIGNILPVSHIVLDLEVSSKKRLFEEAGLLLESESGLSRAAVFECLFAREKLGTTALGHGVAIPHGRHAALPICASGHRRVYPLERSRGF